MSAKIIPLGHTRTGDPVYAVAPHYEHPPLCRLPVWTRWGDQPCWRAKGHEGRCDNHRVRAYT